MFDQNLRNITDDLLDMAFRHPDPTVRAKLAEVFCQVRALQDPQRVLPQLTQAAAEPSTIDTLRLHENALVCKIDKVFDYPKPQLSPSDIDIPRGESAGLPGVESLFNRLVEAEKLIRNDIARLQDYLQVQIGNGIRRVTFSLSGVSIAAASQGSNFDIEKVNIAWREALSLWSAVVPLEFQPPFAGEEPRLRIRFVRDNTESQELGNASGAISKTPTGLVGGSFIDIDCDNQLCVDRFLEPVRYPTHVGPFDLITVLTHELGHALGLDHPPLDPVTGLEMERSIMSRTIGDASVTRQLFPYDIQEIQRLYGAIGLAETVPSKLVETGQLIDNSPGIQLQKGSFGLLVFGPMETRTFLDVLVPAKGCLINALRLKFTTITRNVFVNRVATFDGIIPIQEFAVSARAVWESGLAGQSHDLRFGFLNRSNMGNDMIVRMEIYFTKEDGRPESDFGVVQLEQVAVETLQRPLVVHA